MLYKLHQLTQEPIFGMYNGVVYKHLSLVGS